MFPLPRYYALGEDGESVGDRSQGSRASSMNSIQEVTEAQSLTLLNLKYDPWSSWVPHGATIHEGTLENPGEAKLRWSRDVFFLDVLTRFDTRRVFVDPFFDYLGG